MSFVNFSRANCKNCYKCVRSCPVKAIRIKNQQAEIVESKCITCGHCLIVCPQNARNVESDLDKVKHAINEGKSTVVSLAPSFAGVFEEGKAMKFVTALKTLGFKAVEETAIGADVISSLYSSYIKEEKFENVITTCCPSANILVETYYPTLIKYMLPIVSPMIAHGKLLKQGYGKDCFTVFIGPCISKKTEAADSEHSGAIDAVLTFDEVEGWLRDENIELDNLSESQFTKIASKYGSGFPVDGGVINSVELDNLARPLDKISVSGMEECMEILRAIDNKEISGVCVEINVCKGSCAGGPAMIKSSNNLFVRNKLIKQYIKSRSACKNQESINTNMSFTKRFVNKKLDKNMPSESEIKKILREMGKYEPEDELNCGVCGYNSCIDKAKAIYEGMAETDMCLHFMRNKAERLTNVIFENTPNIIILVDEDLIIKELNPAAEEVFMVKAKSVIDKPITVLMDECDFLEVRDTKKSIMGKKVLYPQYNLMLIENILYLEKQNVILAIMNNIMLEEKNKKELMRVKENTLNAAQEVIDKQMRVAQEIASLLGETTAETKMILTKLKKIVVGEDGDRR